jgi:membrane-associated phospholipid phosphatase
MLQIIIKNKVLFSGYILVFIVCLLFLLSHGKSQSHLFLTGFRSVFLEETMKIFTWLGDGIFMVLAGILLLFQRVRHGLIILASFLASSLVVQLLKRFVFEDCNRPVAWFHELGIEINRIEGLQYYTSFSFPSGHTTTAFAMFFGFAFFVRNTGLKLLFLVLAIITGFSRIYLSQHFMGDVLAGSVIGILTAIATHVLFQKAQSEWLNENIISLIRKRNVEI